MRTAKISVVMPIYNVEAFVGEAVQSVLNQSFEDFELICVDDGGTDRSMEIVRDFNDDRIRIISQTKRGLAAARNAGIEQARGVFIALLSGLSNYCFVRSSQYLTVTDILILYNTHKFHITLSNQTQKWKFIP